MITVHVTYCNQAGLWRKNVFSCMYSSRDHIQHLLATTTIYYLLLKKGSTKITVKRFITLVVEYFYDRNFSCMHACVQNSPSGARCVF